MFLFHFRFCSHNSQRLMMRIEAFLVRIQIVSSKLRSQLNSVTPFLPVNKPKWLKRSSKLGSLAFSRSNRENKSCFPYEYSSSSNEFSCLATFFWRVDKRLRVELLTVELCWSNGIAKRRLNVSSNTYWDIWNWTFANCIWILFYRIEIWSIRTHFLVFRESKIGHTSKILFGTS